MPGALPVGIPWDGQFPRIGSFQSSKSWHAYVHIPFCEVRCGYCDFNTYTADEIKGVRRADFDHSLAKEITTASDHLDQAGAQKKPFSTVFFGGGTPSLFRAEQIKHVLGELRMNFGIESNAEITMELNPDTVDQKYLDAIAELGITRVSIGAQSFDPEVLRVLDRTHNPENVEASVTYAKNAGLQVSVDLIYGTPGESLGSWQESLVRTLSMNPDHLSAYALIVEVGTKLSRQISKGVYPAPDDDLMADKYQLLDEMATQAGLGWYELSNFSKGVQTRSQHNLAYWKSNYWYGFGPGAHSFIGDIRFWNKKHPSAYSDFLTEQLPIQAYEKIEEHQHLQERLMLEIRLSEGVDVGLLTELGVSQKVIEEQIEYGYLEAVGNRYLLTLKGRQMADRVVLNLLNY
jgi:putative oxygen-independent coproporphyrinogen III oxidase